MARLEDYGLGWFLEDVNGHRHVHHPGGAPGTATIISRYPDDRLTVILLANGGAAYVQGLDRGIAQRYIPGLVSRVIVKLDPTLLDSYTGYYNVFGSQILKVTRNGDELLLDALAQARQPVPSLSGDHTHRRRGCRSWLHVDQDREGRGLRPDAAPGRGRDACAAHRPAVPVPRAQASTLINGNGHRKVEASAQRPFLTVGGMAVRISQQPSPQARKDYSRGPSPELDGIRAISFITAQEVSDRGIERHGGKVARILYFGLLTDRAPRHVLVYLTADGLVTDQDTVNE